MIFSELHTVDIHMYFDFCEEIWNPPNVYKNIFINRGKYLQRQSFVYLTKVKNVCPWEEGLLWAVMCPFPTQRFSHSENVPGLRVKDYQIGNLFPSVPFLPQHISSSFNRISFISTEFHLN